MTRGFDRVVTEGSLDAAVAKRLLQHLGITSPEPQDLRGGNNFWAKAPGYNQAAKDGRMIILGLVDLEAEDCAPGLITRHLPKGLEPTFVLRVAIRMLESWLLADRRGMAQFLRVGIERIPNEPESLVHPKRELANLARFSRKREIRETLVPGKDMSGPVGKEYTPMMSRFVVDHWDPAMARLNSPSLDRAMLAIKRVATLP